MRPATVATRSIHITPPDDRQSKRRTKPDYGTVAEIAKAKRFDPAWLRSLGVEDVKGGGIRWPYYSDDGGTVLFYRERGTSQCKRLQCRFFQPKGVGTQLYGLWRDRSGEVWLCEGESDTWSLWAADLPAFGLPGKPAVEKAIQCEHFDGIQDVYLLPDNDPPGDASQLVEAVRKRFASFPWLIHLWRVDVPAAFKDVCEWRANDPERFKTELMQAKNNRHFIEVSPHSTNGHRNSVFGSFPYREEEPKTESEPANLTLIPCSQLQRQPEDALWLWEGFIARANVTLISALFKAGKTTLLSHLLKAMEQDGEFVGRKVQGCRTLCITEEHQSKWAERRDNLKLTDRISFIIRPFANKPSFKEWQTFLEQLKSIQEREKFDLIVLDTLSNLWPVRDENNAAEVQAALMPLHGAIGDAALAPIHHLRKADGQEGTGTRGSGALLAFVDIIVELRRFNAVDRKDTRRVLTGYGRYEQTPGELVIDLRDGSYFAEGDRADIRSRELRKVLREILPDQSPGWTVEKILENWPEKTKPARQDLLNDLRRGTEAEPPDWQRDGKGKKGSPFTYWIDDEGK